MSQWAVDMRRKGLFWRLGEVLLDCGGPAGWGFLLVLSRSMRISVPFPYALISTASLSICSSVRPALGLMILRSWRVLVPLLLEVLVRSAGSDARGDVRCS